MIDLYFWPTPNGYKALIALEAFGLPYRLKPVNIFTGEQFDPSFLEIAPNNRIPAIVDHRPEDGAGPLALFESGAILSYQQEKAAGPLDLRKRTDISQWLHWQMGGIGPMMGQASHFRNYAPEPVPYAFARYHAESLRLLGVLEKRLQDRPFIAGDWSVADMAIYPWVRVRDVVGVTLDDLPRVADWTARIDARPEVIRAYGVGEPLKAQGVLDEAARRHLFGQPPTESPTGPA